jgi:hypothetical protein
MRKFLILVTLLAGAGCASQQINPEQAAALRANIPKCLDQRECDGMWAAARNWVTGSCGMKIQTMSDNFIETYGPIDGRVACRVTRDPEPAGGYSFHVLVNYGAPFMGSYELQMLQSFQSTVRTAGEAFVARAMR